MKSNVPSAEPMVKHQKHDQAGYKYDANPSNVPQRVWCFKSPYHPIEKTRHNTDKQHGNE